jgi:cell division septum initiation protein DivIVA
MSSGDAETGFHIPLKEEGFDVRDPVPRAIRDPSFAAAVRGYDRRAVDSYVERVNRLIAELQVAGSPRAAVRHALERVGEQTAGILQHARETAEEITTSARVEAEETTVHARNERQEILTSAREEASDAVARARAEAADTVADARAEADELVRSARAEAEDMVARARVDVEGRIRRAEEEIAALQEQAARRMQALQADIAAISDERTALLDGLERIAERLDEIVAERAPTEDKPAPEGLQEPDAAAPEVTGAAASGGRAPGPVTAAAGQAATSTAGSVRSA